jgi:hypothetical protein
MLYLKGEVRPAEADPQILVDRCRHEPVSVRQNKLIDRMADGNLVTIAGLIVSKSHDRIDTHSFPRRYIRREQRDGQKHERNAGK